jgi:hypothetical protein
VFDRLERAASDPHVLAARIRRGRAFIPSSLAFRPQAASTFQLIFRYQSLNRHFRGLVLLQFVPQSTQLLAPSALQNKAVEMLRLYKGDHLGSKIKS